MIPKRELAEKGLAGQLGDHDLRVPLELVAQPLEVAVPTTHRALLQAEYWQVRLDSDRHIAYSQHIR